MGQELVQVYEAKDLKELGYNQIEAYKILNGWGYKLEGSPKRVTLENLNKYRRGELSE